MSKKNLNISDQVFKDPIKGIHLLNKVWSAEHHENMVELADGRTLEFARIKSDQIAAYPQNIDQYRYFMVTGCLVTEINPPLPHPDIIAKK